MERSGLAADNQGREHFVTRVPGRFRVLPSPPVSDPSHDIEGAVRNPSTRLQGYFPVSLAFGER
jgi:hypothetical protein